MEPTHQTATALVEAIASGALSSREVLETHIERVEAVEPTINAVTARMYERAREEAAAADDAVARGDDLGPLHGLPISIKEQFLVEDTPTTWGKPSRAGHRATEEGPLLRRLRGAGAIPFVKTNVPVLLLETETHNPLYGRTNNPWDVDRTPGGSSGGEGALLAARGAPLGLGADIGGSLRIPAHYCGITSIKSTPHRLPWNDNPIADFPDWQEAIVPVAGPMARNVTDLRLEWEVLVDGDDDAPVDPLVPPLPSRDPEDIDLTGMRVGYYETDELFPVAPALRRAAREAAAALEDAGAAIEAWTPPDPEEIFTLYAGLIGCDGWRHAQDELGDDPLSPVLRLLTLGGRTPGALGTAASLLARGAGQSSAMRVLNNLGTLSTYEYGERLIAQDAMRRRLARGFRDGPTIVLGPPAALPALRHGRFRDLMLNAVQTFLPNLTGLPAGIVPVTRVRNDEETDRRPGLDVVQRLARETEVGSGGLPVGVQVMAPWWREDLVLAAMSAIEARVDGVPAPPL